MKAQISIISADYICDYKLNLKFNDGKETIVDFGPFILQSHHSDISKYQNINKFKEFHIDFGDLEWNDYELAFPVFDLYQGNIMD